MKKYISMAAAVFLTIAATYAPAQAGAARRHTIEGILIGTGAVLLGTAIVNSMTDSTPVEGVRRPFRRFDRNHHRRHCPEGHWEVTKIWIEPLYETRWNPAHYNHQGLWVPGRYQKFVITDGYWKKERVWVRHHARY